MAQLMTKRIPISEDLWKELGKLKEAGQTYDELVRELIQAKNRIELAKEFRDAAQGKGKWIPLEDIDVQSSN